MGEWWVVVILVLAIFLASGGKQSQCLISRYRLKFDKNFPIIKEFPYA